MLRLCVILFLSAATSAGSATNVFVTEVLYDPVGSSESKHEFVELYNAGPALDLQGWQIGDAVGSKAITTEHFLFDTGARLVLSEQSLSEFNARWGILLPAANFVQVHVIPTFNNSGGDSVVLSDPNGVAVCRVDYREKAPWPGNAANASLSFTNDPRTVTPAQNNDGVNWAISVAGVAYAITDDQGSVGSPGSVAAVPEPAAALVLIPGALAFVSRVLLQKRHGHS